ncbi:MAG: amidohydrolase family protein [Archangium sp.]
MRVLAMASLVLLSGCLTRYSFPKLVEKPSASERILISNVSVFDGVSQTLLADRDVLISDGRIQAVAQTGTMRVADAKFIDGMGKTLMPGFINFHVHLSSSPSAPWKAAQPDPQHAGRALLYAGITGAQDVGGDVEELEKLQQNWLGPDFIYAGKMITTRDGYPVSMVRDLLPWPVDRIAEGIFATQISTPEEAKKAVDNNVAHGAKLIKVAVAQIPLDAPVYSPELLKAVVDAAHAKNVKVAAHIDTAEHALLAARAGVDLLVHGVHLGKLTDEQAAELKSLGTVVAPTLVVWDRIEQLIENRFAPTQLEKETWPAEFLHEFDPSVTSQHTLSPGLMEWIRKLQASKADRIEAVATLHRAGVPLLVGADDNGSVGCMASGAFHDEMRQLVEAGVPSIDVLMGATSTAAKLTGLGSGTIEQGAAANLVLLDGDPIADINATTRIVLVIKDGTMLKRSSILQEAGNDVAKQ